MPDFSQQFGLRNEGGGVGFGGGSPAFANGALPPGGGPSPGNFGGAFFQQRGPTDFVNPLGGALSGLLPQQGAPQQGGFQGRPGFQGQDRPRRQAPLVAPTPQGLPQNTGGDLDSLLASRGGGLGAALTGVAPDRSFTQSAFSGRGGF